MTHYTHYTPCRSPRYSYAHTHPRKSVNRAILSDIKGQKSAKRYRRTIFESRAATGRLTAIPDGFCNAQVKYSDDKLRAAAKFIYEPDLRGIANGCRWNGVANGHLHS